MQNDGIRYWYKENPEGQVWWEFDSEARGEMVFSFDKETRFYLFSDYPYKLTPEQKRVFDAENPYWRDFFSDRQ